MRIGFLAPKPTVPTWRPGFRSSLFPTMSHPAAVIVSLLALAGCATLQTSGESLQRLYVANTLGYAFEVYHNSYHLGNVDPGDSRVFVLFTNEGPSRISVVSERWHVAETRIFLPSESTCWSLDLDRTQLVQRYMEIGSCVS